MCETHNSDTVDVFDDLLDKGQAELDLRTNCFWEGEGGIHRSVVGNRKPCSRSKNRVRWP